MKTFQQILVFAFWAAATALAVCAILLLLAATATAAAIPGELEAARRERIGMAAARKDVTPQVESVRQDALSRAERQLAPLRADSLVADSAATSANIKESL